MMITWAKISRLFTFFYRSLQATAIELEPLIR